MTDLRGLRQPTPGEPIDATDPILAGCLGFWPMNDGPGARAFADAMGRLPLAFSGSLGWAPGRAGWAGSYPASGVPYASATITYLPLDFTFAAWFLSPKDAGVGGYRIIDFQPSWYVGLAVANNQLSCLDLMDGLTYPSGAGHGPDVSDGAWHHGAIVRDTGAGLVTAYLDGAPLWTAPVTNSFTPSVATGSLYVGCFNGASEAWYGRLQGVGWWGRALKAGEVGRLYSRPWSMYPCAEDALTAAGFAASAPASRLCWPGGDFCGGFRQTFGGGF